MKRKIFGWMMAIALIFGWVTVGSLMTSCSSDDNSNGSEITLEDALKDGTIVALSFNVNGEDFYVAFIRVGDTYELLDNGTMKAAVNASRRADEPTISEKDCEFTMEHDKVNNVITFTVKEKSTSALVLTAIFDIKESTVEVIPGDPKFKITGVKMKVANVEITKLLKEKGEGVTLTDALVKGAKVEVVYKWNNSNTTTFTFINEGGSFSSAITGDNAEGFNSFLRQEGNELFFSAKEKEWYSTDLNFEIKFNYVKNTYKFWTVHHDYYDSFTISVNGTNIMSSLTKED